MRLLLVGFGTVGQGLAELLLAKRDELARRYGLEWQVTGIADTLKGSVYDPAGIDLERALESVRRGESLAGHGREGGAWDGLTMVRHAEADVLLEATYTDIKTGEPATSQSPLIDTWFDIRKRTKSPASTSADRASTCSWSGAPLLTSIIPAGCL